MKRKQKAPPLDFLLLLGLVCVLTALCCLLLYRMDNKYQSNGPAGENGVLLPDGETLNGGRPLWLVTGWAYYGGRLLTPADFEGAAPAPDRFLYIGEFGGLEAGEAAASPHGSASYRLRVRLPEETRAYTLELPEIYSSYKAYINGRPVAQMGETDPAAYRPETGNRTVTFEARGEADILIAVSDFSHLYSGMVYPPAFGTPEAVSGFLYARFLFRAALCLSALTIGLLALFVGLLNRRALSAALYGLLCLFFVGYTAYPVTKTLGSGFAFGYTVERFSFCLVLLLAAVLARHICGGPQRVGRLFLGFGAVVCLASLLLPLALGTGSLPVMRAYSYLVSVYQWATAAFLLWTVWRGSQNSPAYSRPILCGAAAFGAALVMDRLLPLYEPIVTGWFVELASFALVLSVGLAIGREVAGQYRERAVLSERVGGMERLLSLQKTHHAALRAEAEATRAMRHDMRHHFHMIQGLVQAADYDGLAAYVASFGGQLPAGEGPQAEYAQNPVVNVLASHYAFAARQQDVAFDFRCSAGAETGLPEAELCGLLSNLLENALEACRPVPPGGRFVRVGVARLGRMLSIRVENSTGGGLRPAGTSFLSTKGRGRKGYGLASVAAIAQRHGGSADFRWAETERVFTSLVTLLPEGPGAQDGTE